MKELLKLALKAAVDASGVILDIYEGDDFDVTHKEDNSPLTRADLASNNTIKKFLEGTSIPILSEEGKDIAYEGRLDWQQFWLVDPLDGTKEFIKRNGEFTVNIALIESGVPVLGVVAVPAQGTYYAGGHGLGAYRFTTHEVKRFIQSDIDASEVATPLPDKALPARVTVVGSRSHSSPETEAFVQFLKDKHGEVDFISRGSALKLCMIAEGEAHIYPRLAPTMEWDTAAGHALIREVNGTVLEADTRRQLEYNKKVLTNPSFIAVHPYFDL